MTPFDSAHAWERASIIAGLFLIGCFERFVLKDDALSGLSWWICLLSLTVWIAYPFTILRACIGGLTFVLGITLIIRYTRRK